MFALSGRWRKLPRHLEVLTSRGPEVSCDSPGLLRGLIEDINASAQRDMPWRGLMNKGVGQVDLPALLHQRTQRIDDSVALVERAAIARGVQNAAEFFRLFILSAFS